MAIPLTNASAQQLAYQQLQTDITPPWSLTASDGEGLLLTGVEAKAVFEGPLAFTELHLYFRNDEDRVREGTFQITLPSNAAVSRFAMETDGQMVEAEVVDKMVARRAYDDFLHRRQDPALLEKGAGNQFTAKVFPIAAKADKHIVISFSQQLPGTQYVLPLRGLPTTERVDVSLSILGADGKRSEQTLSERNWKPDRDFVSNANTSAAAVAAGPLVAAQVGFETNPGEATPPKALTILVDTSASRAAGYARYIKNVRDLVASIAKDYGASTPVDVIAFDQDTRTIYTGPAGSYGDAADKALFERGAAGASDLEQALAAIPRLPDRGQNVMRRLVVITDGVMTAGDSNLAGKIAQVDHLDRVDVVLAGGIRDDAMAAQITRALPTTGAVLDLDAEGPALVASALAEPVMVDVPVAIPGAEWVFPAKLPAIRAGHRAMVYAHMSRPAQSIDISIGGHTQTTATIAVAPALVERAVAGAEIDELESKLETATGDAAKQLKTRISTMSVAARVVSSQTAMLVLESDSDYARYHIDRTALADILVVGPHGIEQTHRKAASIAIARTEPASSDPWDKTKSKDAKKRNAQTGKETEKAEKVALEKNREDNEAGEGDGAANVPMGGSMGSAAAPQEELDYKPAPDIQPATVAPAPPPPPPPPAAPATRAVADPPAQHSPRHLEQRVAARDDDASGDGLAMAQDQDQADPRDAWPPKDSPAALHGPLADVEQAIARKDVDGALHQAREWHDKDPGDVLALIGLGESLEAKHANATAARVYGSIIDLFPARADMRRFAGERLERLGQAPAWLAVDTYKRAVEDRPDHLTGHRLLAYALLRDGKPAEAFAAILAGVDQPYPSGRYAGADRVLAEDAGMIGAAYLAADPSKRADVEAELAKRHIQIATQPSTRFILYWETDANDVDFHIQDARGNHAFFGHKDHKTGGALNADITTGYGPECFAIPGTPSAGPYRLSINYYSQGPMGYGMGILEVQRFDGKGGLTFEDRPYVIMADHAYVDLGQFK